MRKQVNDKRDKFTKQIRAKQHEQYFQLHRQANKSSDLPALAYIPVLLQNQLYDDIQAIMDCIDLGCNTNQSESYSDLIKIINDRFNHHSNENVRLMMFKLLNRLNQWTVQDVGRAIKMVKQGKQEMIKQLSIHFQVQTSSDPQTNKPSIQKQLNQTFAQILSIKIQNPEYRLFWLDLICQTLQTSPAQIKKCLEDPNSFLFAIDLGINAENQFQIVRVLKIVSLLVTYKQLQPRIIQLQCFSKLITIIQNGSIDVLFLGLDLLAELLAYDDIVVARLLNGYKIMNIFKKYLEHIMVGVQARVLWALSNIAGSQHHKIVLMDTYIMEQLNRKVKNPTNPQILSQACCCLLNLLCNSTGQQLQSIDQQINISELIIKVLEQIEQPVIRDTLLERTLYSIYHVLNDFPQSYLKLEQLGLKKFLSSLFQLERDENRLKMIQQVLRVVEKKEKLT